VQLIARRGSRKRDSSGSGQPGACREQAALALRDEDRESWLKLAAKWQRMTEGTHQPAQQAQQPQGKGEG
jgi:hypothetical protein